MQNKKYKAKSWAIYKIYFQADEKQSEQEPEGYEEKEEEEEGEGESVEDPDLYRELYAALQKATRNMQET